MPTFWQIRDGLVWVESHGESSVAEWRAVVEAFLSDPVYRPGMGAIHDWRSRQRVLKRWEVEQEASYLRTRIPALGPCRWAIVVGSAAGYDMSQMAGTLLEGTGMVLGTFRDMAEAEAWVRGEG